MAIRKRNTGTASTRKPITFAASGDATVAVSETETAQTVTIGVSAAAGGNAFGTIAVSGQSNVVADSSNDTLTLVAGSNVTLTTNAAGDSVTIAASGGGLSDGDKGDITVGSSGTTLTIDNGAVTLAKMANLAANSIVGNNTGSPATPLALTATQVKTLLAIASSDVSGLGTLATQSGTFSGTSSGTNTGDQTSIVGITGTKAQFDTAVTDGNFLYVGDVTQYTDEAAQDAVGAMVDTTLVYTDGTPLLQRAALTGDVTASAGSNATTIAADAVTYAKMQNVSAASRLLGRGSAGGSGDPEEITLGSGLSMSGTTLSASSGSSPVVYVATPADTSINVLADATIVTRDVTGMAAGDQLVVEADFVILNNSTATRALVFTLDFDAAFDVEFTTGALAFSSTLMHPFYLRAVLDIRSTSLAYATFVCEGQLAAGIASGTDTTMAATHLRGMGWGTSAADLTGTCTVALKARSPSTSATQTFRLHRLTISKYTPT